MTPGTEPIRELFMSRPKVLLAVLIALLAASACASAVASAAPPELRGDFFPMKYAGSIGTARWEVPGAIFTCVSGGSTSEGEITGVKRITAVIHLRGCGAEGGWCTSEGAKTGELVTQPLEGTPVYLKKGESGSMWIVFKPESGVNVLNKFYCLGLSGEFRGTVIARVKNGRWEHTTKLNLAFNQSGETEYLNEEGGNSRASLETNWGGGVFQSVSWGFEDTLNTSPQGEVLGVVEIGD
jgi:opacity protein-like surface antigen